MLEANVNTLTLVGRAFTQIRKPNLYDLFSLHAEARGGLSEEKEAKTVFAPDRGVTPFQTEKIMSEFLV
jgi:hypothetical protein